MMVTKDGYQGITAFRAGVAHFIANMPKRPIRQCFTEFAWQKYAVKYAAKSTLPRKLAKEIHSYPMRCNKNAVTAGVTAVVTVNRAAGTPWPAGN